MIPDRPVLRALLAGSIALFEPVPAHAQAGSSEAASTAAEQSDRAGRSARPDGLDDAREALQRDPPQRAHLFGDWGGARTTLNDRGISYDLDYLTESGANLSGGQRQLATYAHQISLSMDVDGGKLAGIDGLKLHGTLINRRGRDLSTSAIGDTLIQAQEIYGSGFGATVKLAWLYAEQSLAHGRVDVAAGRFLPSTDFATSPLYCSFITLTICGSPHSLTGTQGYEVFPLSSWGARINVKLSGQSYVRVGVFQSQPYPSVAQPHTLGGRSGFNWTFKGTTGASIPVEIGYEPEIDNSLLPGHYKIGMVWDTSRFDDLYFDADRRPQVISGARPLRHSGRALFWAEADQMVWRHGPYRDSGLYLLAAYTRTPPSSVVFRNFLWFGLVDKAPIAGRGQDQLSIGITFYDVSRRARRTQALQIERGLPLLGGANGYQQSAAVYEVNYALEVGKGLRLQPGLEYFVRPGGVDTIPNALAFVVRTELSF